MNLSFVVFTGSGACFTVDFRRENTEMCWALCNSSSCVLQFAVRHCAQTGLAVLAPCPCGALPGHFYPILGLWPLHLNLKHADKAAVFFLQSSAHLWHHYEHREAYQKLLEDIAVLRRLAARLSSRAEMVGAVRQVRPSWCLVVSWIHRFTLFQLGPEVFFILWVLFAILTDWRRLLQCQVTHHCSLEIEFQWQEVTH